MRTLLTSAFIIGSFLMSGQARVDIRILELVNNQGAIQMEYEEINLETSSTQELKTGYANTPSISLPKDLVVYLNHPRLGLIRTHIRDLMRQGPSMWKDKYFRLHMEGDEVKKLEEIYILE